MVASRNLLVDSHCHIDFPDFSEDLDSVLQRAAENGVAYLLCVSVELQKFKRIKALTDEAVKSSGHTIFSSS